MRYFITLIICAIGFSPMELIAQGSDPYFAFEEGFALSQQMEMGRYPITTFIPRGYLLFVRDRKDSKEISGRKYLAATTQDGVDVFVLESAVTKKTFRETVGNQEIIFNSANVLCRSPGCDENDPEQVWQIHAGEAFKIIESTHGFYKIRGDRFGNEVIGYIKDSHLENLTRHGYVTRADLRHPKYTITRTEGKESETECGEKREEGDEKKVGAGITLEIPILKTFGIGIAGGVEGARTVKITRSYGGDNQKYSFLIYTIRNNRAEETSTFVAQVIYTCESGGLIRPLKKIERVDLKNPETGETYSLSFSSFRTPDDLLPYTRSPYLFSVNSYRQYRELMDSLGTLFDDRALAGYFLSEFNRSSRSQDRLKAKCQNYSYKID
jgi:hypothetical protein